jgi:hypothetical protein
MDGGTGPNVYNGGLGTDTCRGTGTSRSCEQ